MWPCTKPGYSNHADVDSDPACHRPRRRQRVHVGRETGRRTGVYSGPDRGRTHHAGGKANLLSGVGPKIVEGKQRPSRLIARDGTSCLASPKKFRETEIGESVWCSWGYTD